MPEENEEESEEAHQQVGAARAATRFFGVYQASRSTGGALSRNLGGSSRPGQAAKTDLLCVLIGAKSLFLGHLM